ncbi:MAG TPA: leucyl/phenylalanyl-tRNA--protein transferase [Polyangiaceae bacterium]
MTRRARPALLGRNAPPTFPNPSGADAEGLVAIGGDLSTERLLAAYEQGIFPWYNEGLPPMWWSPDPRAVMDPERLHVSRSLARVLRRGGFEVTFDRAFEQVMLECGRERDDGTWIIPDMLAAYVELHRCGHAHSFEVWRDGRLAGGLYGVHRGGLFAAESMFHRETDASKVALVVAVRSLFAAGIELFDVQFSTDHLESLGAYEMRRVDYLARVAEAKRKTVSLAAGVTLLTTQGE